VPLRFLNRIALSAAALLATGVLCSAPPAHAQTPAAFPGAQGGGAASKGGRGGEVCEVTTLEDTGPNSFRDCLSRKGPRTVVFRVAGRINLKTGIRVANPYLTIAGQTAPGGGIEFSGVDMNDGAMVYIYTHDVVVRYLHFRIGAGAHHSPGPSTGCVGIFVGNEDVYNVMLDHLSISWSDNKPITIWSNYGPGVHNMTVQWTITSEGIMGHSVGLGTGNSNKTTAAFMDIDFHHNFFADHSHRLPETAQKSMRFVNNIIYNWNFYASATLGSQASDFIGNLYKSGPLNSEAQKYELHFSDKASGWDDGPPSIYLLGNKGPNQQNPKGDQWAMTNRITGENGKEIGPIPPQWRRPIPLPPEDFPISTDDVNNLESPVFAAVGDSQRVDCNGNWVPRRDAVDTRLIAEYHEGKGILPRSEKDVGGFPTVDPDSACPDKNHNGIPDAWEAAHHLKSAADANKLQPDGYTNLEHYLNGTATDQKH
jgi:pectate lyase